MHTLLRHGVSFWLVEADAVWFQDPSSLLPEKRAAFHISVGNNDDFRNGSAHLLMGGFVHSHAGVEARAVWFNVMKLCRDSLGRLMQVGGSWALSVPPSTRPGRDGVAGVPAKSKFTYHVYNDQVALNDILRRGEVTHPRNTSLHWNSQQQNYVRIAAAATFARRSISVKWTSFPHKHVSGGLWYKHLKNRQIDRKPRIPMVLNINYLVGNSNKIQPAQRYGHWFLGSAPEGSALHLASSALPAGIAGEEERAFLLKWRPNEAGNMLICRPPMQEYCPQAKAENRRGDVGQRFSIATSWYGGSDGDATPTTNNDVDTRDSGTIPRRGSPPSWREALEQGMRRGGAVLPALSVEDVLDREATMVADPFVVHRRDVLFYSEMPSPAAAFERRRSGQETQAEIKKREEMGSWYLFFEVLNNVCQKGEIGSAVWDDAAARWTYLGIVLQTPTHLSYPHVFEDVSSEPVSWWYMVPENHRSMSIPLYRTSRRLFPRGWQYVSALVSDIDAVDTSVVFHNRRWYLLTSELPRLDLRVFVSADSRLYDDGGDAVNHYTSLQGTAPGLRFGGRVLVESSGVMHVFFQNGFQVRAAKVEILTPQEMRLATPELILAAPGNDGSAGIGGGEGNDVDLIDWRSSGMHHIDIQYDPQRQVWVVVSDGVTAHDLPAVNASFFSASADYSVRVNFVDVSEEKTEGNAALVIHPAAAEGMQPREAARLLLEGSDRLKHLAGIAFVVRSVETSIRNMRSHRCLQKRGLVPNVEEGQISEDLVQVERTWGAVRNGAVDGAIRIIVLAMDRPRSLLRLLESLERADYDNDEGGVVLDILVDFSGSIAHEQTLALAQNFRFSHGPKYVRTRQGQNGGLARAWYDAWTPTSPSARCVILEDDLEVSPVFYRYLQSAWQAYHDRSDIAGITLQRQVLQWSPYPRPVSVTNAHDAFLYSLVGTWGFSPHPKVWTKFLEWRQNVVDTSGQSRSKCPPTFPILSGHPTLRCCLVDSAASPHRLFMFSKRALSHFIFLPLAHHHRSMESCLHPFLQSNGGGGIPLVYTVHHIPEGPNTGQ